MRRQPRTLGAAGRAGPQALSRPRAGGAARPHRLPAGGRVALPAHAARVRLLLVQARDRRRSAALARGSPAARGHAGPGAVRRLDELLPRPGGAVAHRHGGEAAHPARRGGAAGLPQGAALVRGEGRGAEARASGGPRDLEGRERELADRSRERRGHGAAGDLLRAARARVGGRRRGAGAGARADARPRAPAGERRHDRRRARRPGLLPAGRESDRRGPGGRDRPWQAALRADARLRRDRRRGRGQAPRRPHAEPELEHRGDARRAAVPQMLPQAARGPEPGTGDRPPSHRRCALPELRAARRRAGARRRRRDADHARAAPGVRAEPGGRLEHHAGLSGALPRRPPHRRGCASPRRARGLPVARAHAGNAHGRAARRARAGRRRTRLRARAGRAEGHRGVEEARARRGRGVARTARARRRVARRAGARARREAARCSRASTPARRRAARRSRPGIMATIISARCW